MRECPSCQRELLPSARFCTHCGESVLVVSVPVPFDDEPTINRRMYPFSLSSVSAITLPVEKHDALASDLSTNGEPEQEKAQDVALFYVQEVSSPEEEELDPADPYALKKRELRAQCTRITAAMESLLSFVYEDHRAENQELFASTLKDQFSLDDPVWGRIAFVLGAYGNYMYRYPLNDQQKRQVWQALLWAVYYERCYRRKYLAQRCQQLLHFFQGCATDPIFLSYAIPDLDELHTYLEAGSLKKLEETLQQLLVPPEALLRRVSAQLVEAQARKLEQMSKQPPPKKPSQPANNQSRLSQAATSPAGLKSPVKKEVANPSPSLSHLQPVQAEEKGGALAGKNGNGAVSSRPKAPPELVTPAARKVLSFFSDIKCKEFLNALRNARLDSVNTMLQSVRQPLLDALLKDLNASEMRQYQAPRRPIRLGKKTSDHFTDARRLLQSPRPGDQQTGLHLFEQGARETTHPDYTLLAREWMLYARAVVHGGHRVVNDWETSFQRKEASWEEIWNLAVFYHQTDYPLEALRVLSPGIKEKNAPLAHLRFALVSSLRLLLESGRYTLAAQQQAHSFLGIYLEKWPHPLACLAWLILIQETYGQLHPRLQSQCLSSFQELVDHPLTLPDPQKDLQESRVAALEEDLTGRLSYPDAWYLWIHDYAEYHPRNYQAWSRLADTSEQFKYLNATEHALQHLVEIQYHHDYARYQEGTPLPRAEYLRRNLEKLFEFYQRYHLTGYAAEAFDSCYTQLRHLWEPHDPANQKLITLTKTYLDAHQIEAAETISIRRQGVTRELGKSTTAPLEFNASKLVGIFVDYENIAPFIGRDLEIEAVGRALVDYAAQFGTVVCRWAAASPSNLSNLADVRVGLESARFKVRFPRRELQFSASKKNLADFALLECLSEAAVNERPDIYLIVSGDRDYYERICSLLDSGHTVRMLAATDSQHLSLRYRELEQQRMRIRQAAGHQTPDFFIDDLEDILYPPTPIL